MMKSVVLQLYEKRGAFLNFVYKIVSYTHKYGSNEIEYGLEC